MVLKGRKPVVYLPLPKDITDNAEVFEMRGTGEVFMDYESYLKRHVHPILAYTCTPNKLMLTIRRYEWLTEVRPSTYAPT